MIDPLERWREYGEKPDYAGPLSFGSAPYTQDPALLAGFDVAIVGAPTDDLVSDRPGTRFGPARDSRRELPLRPASGDEGGRLCRAPHRRLRGCAGSTRRSRALGRRDREDGRRSARRGPDPDRARRRPFDRRAGHHGLRSATRPGRACPLRHAHRHRHRGLRRRGVARDADVPARPQRGGRPGALRPDRHSRLLARRAGVRLAGRAGDHVDLHARGAGRGDRRGPRAGGRSRRRRARSSSPSTSTCSIRPLRPAPARRSPAA